MSDFFFNHIRCIECKFEVRRSEYRTWIDFSPIDDLKYNQVEVHTHQGLILWADLTEIEFSCTSEEFVNKWVKVFNKLMIKDLMRLAETYLKNYPYVSFITVKLDCEKVISLIQYSYKLLVGTIDCEDDLAKELGLIK